MQGKVEIETTQEIQVYQKIFLLMQELLSLMKLQKYLDLYKFHQRFQRYIPQLLEINFSPKNENNRIFLELLNLSDGKISLIDIANKKNFH